MMASIASDDVVADAEEAAGNEREPLVVTEPLAAFLDEQGIGSGSMEFAAIGDGHSNVTFLVSRGDAEFVLRRPPRGPLPPSAHDVLREARVLGAIAGHARVPKVLAACSDESVIGAPFYVMAKVEGQVLTTAVPAALDTLDNRRRIAEELVDALAEVHAINWQSCGLEGFGRPTGYAARQVRRFTGLWEHNKTRDVPQVEKVGTWLATHLPDSPPATIVHGDYRLGNVMLAPEAPVRLNAIFDWEMSTIGDPLADLGYLCTFWASADEPPLELFDLSPVTREPGFLGRDELIARYEEQTGRTAGELRWYQALALWKAAIFMEGNYSRAARGSSDDAWTRGFGAGVIELAQRAEEVIS